jgi:hypothetical protein
MRHFNKIFLLLVLVFFVACGTGTTEEINDDRFDMWEYMTATINYEVEYAVYEDGKKVDYYHETHKMFENRYEKESSMGVTTLYRNKRDILMKEPSRDVTIERYVQLGDNHIFTTTSISNCKLEYFYKVFENKNQRYHNVLMVSCLSHSDVKQDFYYGYNEGIVSISENDHGSTKEWVKVSEKSIP